MNKSPEEEALDNKWYEALAEKIRTFGKQWPEPLTKEEYEAAEQYADSVVRRPRGEREAQ